MPKDMYVKNEIVKVVTVFIRYREKLPSQVIISHSLLT